MIWRVLTLSTFAVFNLGLENPILNPKSLTKTVLDRRNLNCNEAGWDQTSTICFRIVHKPRTFLAAQSECQSISGTLLQLDKVSEVMEVLGNSMMGNADNYRIDGWLNATWLEGEGQTLVLNESSPFALDTKLTLTLNLQDGQVSASWSENATLGYICQREPVQDDEPCEEIASAPPTMTIDPTPPLDSTPVPPTLTIDSASSDPASTPTVMISTTLPPRIVDNKGRPLLCDEYHWSPQAFLNGSNVWPTTKKVDKCTCKDARPLVLPLPEGSLPTSLTLQDLTMWTATQNGDLFVWKSNEWSNVSRLPTALQGITNLYIEPITSSKGKFFVTDGFSKVSVLTVSESDVQFTEQAVTLKISKVSKPTFVGPLESLLFPNDGEPILLSQIKEGQWTKVTNLKPDSSFLKGTVNFIACPKWLITFGKQKNSKGKFLFACQFLSEGSLELSKPARFRGIPPSLSLNDLEMQYACLRDSFLLTLGNRAYNVNYGTSVWKKSGRFALGTVNLAMPYQLMHCVDE